jgi:hypothetical protein
MARQRRLFVIVGLLAAVAALAARTSAQEAAAAMTRITPHGPSYGYPDPEDPGRFVWVFLDGVEIEQPVRSTSTSVSPSKVAAGYRAMYQDLISGADQA